MKSRVLKRPMFRIGGDVENTGIMDGMRQRYKESDPQGVQPKREPMLFRPSMSDFLIQFGLDLASRSPGGNIFQTAAAAAKEPFAIMQAKKMREGELEGERAFKRELLETEMEGAKERAQIAAGIKSYDTYVDVGFKKYNDIVLAENFANFMTKTKPQIDSGFGSSQFAGFIEQDLSKENVKNRFIKNNAGKIGKVFFDLKQNRLLQLKRIDNEGNVDLVPTTIANIGDTEGTTMPTPQKSEAEIKKDSSSAYREDINKKLKKLREKRIKDLDDKFSVENDVDI